MSSSPLPVRLVRLSALALAAAMIPAGTAVAAKTGPAPAAPSIALSSGATSVPIGTWMTFVSSYPTAAKDPGIRVVCTQNGSVVWSQVGTPDASYKLGGDSSPWLQTGGSANCVADLINVSWSRGQQTTTVLATTGFTGLA
jgi:hypothetical protein